MAQTQVGRKATLIKNVVIGPHLCTRIAAITRNETYEVKLNISIILRARTEFLRTTRGAREISTIYERGTSDPRGGSV